MGFDSTAVSSLLPSCWGFSFALGRGVSLFDGNQHSPVDGWSAGCCNTSLPKAHLRILILSP